MQPDVYCRRLQLQVPVAVSVKTDQMADVFHRIGQIAIHPYVCPCILCAMYQVVLTDMALILCSSRLVVPRWMRRSPVYRLTAIPGGADRALSVAARMKMFVTMGALLGGLSAGLLFIYRTFGRPGAFGTGWAGTWASWLFGGVGRREL